MGAWIEIYNEPSLKLVKEVAPFVGAWIEINSYDQLLTR